MRQDLLKPVTFVIILASRFSGHKTSSLGAALAYYAVFSLGPLMVIAIAIAGFVFGDEAARGEVSAQLTNLLGDNGAQAVEAMLAGADRHHNGLVAATIGVGTLLVAAIWVVVAFKEALNTIWDVAAAPSAGIWSMAKSYLASLVGVVVLGFLLLVSLLMTTALTAGAAYITPFVSTALLHAMSLLLSFAAVSLLFAMMFKWLPDTDIAWGDVWLGAIVTAALFEDHRSRTLTSCTQRLRQRHCRQAPLPMMRVEPVSAKTQPVSDLPTSKFRILKIHRAKTGPENLGLLHELSDIPRQSAVRLGGRHTRY
jgi:membrane protein